MSYKRRFPFKIGCTSYVIPDTIIPNVTFMADIVDDIELLFFESSNNAPYLTNAEIRELGSIAAINDITYSVHCPIDIAVGASDVHGLDNFLYQIEQITEQSKKLPVSGYIVHLDGLQNNFTEEELSSWYRKVNYICNKIITNCAVDTKLFCIENLTCDPFVNIKIIDKYNFSACIDCGHLWHQKHDWQKYCSTLFSNTKVFHLHGVTNNKDHCSLINHDHIQLESFIKTYLKDFTNIVTIELFGKEITFESLAIVRELWEK